MTMTKFRGFDEFPFDNARLYHRATLAAMGTTARTAGADDQVRAIRWALRFTDRPKRNDVGTIDEGEAAVAVLQTWYGRLAVALARANPIGDPYRNREIRGKMAAVDWVVGEWRDHASE